VLGAAWCAELAGVCGALQQLGLGAAAEEAHTRIINRWGGGGLERCLWGSGSCITMLQEVWQHCECMGVNE